MKGYLATITTQHEADLLFNFYKQVHPSSTSGGWIAATSLRYSTNKNATYDQVKNSLVTPSNYEYIANPTASNKKITGTNGAYYWTTVYASAQYRDYYYWACGPEAGQIVPYSLWASGEPNNHNQGNPGENCAVASYSGAYTFNDFALTQDVPGYFLEFSAYEDGLAPGSKYHSATIYKVSFNGNGATGGSVPAPMEKIEGVPLTICGNTGNLTNSPNSWFAGWFSNTSATNYTPVTTYETDAATTLYAHWSKSGYSDLYDPVVATGLVYNGESQLLINPADGKGVWRINSPSDNTSGNYTYRYSDDKAGSFAEGSVLDSSKTANVGYVGEVDDDSAPIHGTDAGTYTFYWNWDCDDSYADGVHPEDRNKLVATIAPKPITSADVSAEADSTSLEYSGSAQAPQITVTDSSRGVVLTKDTEYTLTYVGTGDTSYASSETAPTNVGTYKVVITGKGNYNQSREIAFSIVKVAPEVTAPISKTMPYSGSAQALVTAGSTPDGKMYYAVGANATDVPTSGWSETVPEDTPVADYYVWYKVVGDSNHSDTEPDCITSKIVKVAPEVNAPVAKTVPYNAADQELVTAGSTPDGTMYYAVGENATDAPTDGWSTDVPKDKPASTYYVWYKVTGDANHLDAGPVCLESTITKIAPEYTAPIFKNMAFNDADQVLVVAGSTTDGTMVYAVGENDTDAPTDGWSEELPKDKPAGTYYVWYKVTGDGNHLNSTPACVTSKITKVVPKYTAPVAKTMTYNASDQPLATEGSCDEGTMLYAVGANATDAPTDGWSEEMPEDMPAGTYYVWYKVVGDENHLDTEHACVTSEIEKAEPEVTAPTAKTMTYDATNQELVEEGSTPDGTMYYAVGENATDAPTDGWSTDVPKDKPAGTYYVWYKVTGDENHLDADPVCLTSKIEKAEPEVTAPTAKTMTYNAADQKLVDAGSTPDGKMYYAVGANDSDAPTDGWSESVPEDKPAGDYYVWYKVVGDENHLDTEPACVTSTIQKAEPSVTAPKSVTETYNGANQELVEAGSTPDGTMLYAVGENDTDAPTEGWSESVPEDKPAGPYYVWYKVAGDANHLDTEPACITSAIEKAVLTAKYVDETIDCSETPELIVGVDGFVGGENPETADGFSFPAVTAPDEIEAGESYELTPEGGTADNYEFDYKPGTLEVEEHVPGEMVIENEVAPTCEEDGSHDEVVYCEVCGDELERLNVVDPAIGHKWGEWTVVKEPTDSEEGLEQRVCEHDETHIETRPIDKLVFEYLDVKGDGQTWYKGSRNSADFTFVRSINDPVTYSHFTGVLVDGRAIKSSDYDAEPGSVIVHLKPAFLETLSVGRHTLTALFDDGNDVTVIFYVKVPGTGPNTGDPMSMLPIFAMFGAALASIAGAAIVRKKENRA